MMPNFFIVGAVKAGTTSVYEYLRQHPNVYISPIKEPNFFSTDIDAKTFADDYRRRLAFDINEYLNRSYKDDIHAIHISNWDEYLHLFEGAGNKKALGEASVSYLYSQAAAALIKEKIPHARIIMILRNPAERAYSHYLMDLRMGYTALPFRRALEKDMQQSRKGWGISHLYVELGNYHDQVKRYLDIFEPKQVKIFLYEQLSNPNTFMKELFRFIGVDDSIIIDTVIRHNAYRVPKSPILNYWIKNSPLISMKKLFTKNSVAAIASSLYQADSGPSMAVSDRKYMVDLYRPEVEKLMQLLNRDLDGWLR